MARHLKVQIGEQWYAVELRQFVNNPVRALVDGVPVEVVVDGLPAAETPGLPDAAPGSEGPFTGQTTAVRAPMLGVIVSVAVSMGQQVSASDRVCVLEALKLQQSIRAPVGGVVRAIHVQAGQEVNSDQVIVELG